MRIGYAVMNTRVESRNRNTTVISPAPDRVAAAARDNLLTLQRILEFNVERGILFFRPRSDLVPHATHPQARTFDWETGLRDELAAVGRLLREHAVRVNIHPDLFTDLSHPEERHARTSLDELAHQARLLDALGLDRTAKIQLHVGESLGDPDAAIDRFLDRFRSLDPAVQARVVVENDNVFCSFARCLRIHEEIGVPIVFDVLHHEVDGGGVRVPEVMAAARRTWAPDDGLPMVDYSSQMAGRMPGRHARSLDPDHFRAFVAATRSHDFDLMMELKDREASALEALRLLADDPRLER